MGAVDGGGSGEARNRPDSSWGSLEHGCAGGTWGFGRSLLGSMGLSSSCLNLDHCMVIEELGPSTPAHGRIPQVLPTSQCEFSEESRNGPVFRLGNPMLHDPNQQALGLEGLGVGSRISVMFCLRAVRVTVWEPQEAQ